MMGNIRKTMRVFIFYNILWFPYSKAQQKKYALDKNIDQLHDSVVELRDIHVCKENEFPAWCIPKHFNTEIEPWKFRGLTNSSLPWKYHFTFNIIEVEEVNDKMQTVSIVMYFRIKWMEPRLVIEKNNSEWNETTWKDGSLSYSSRILKQIWYPDLEIEGIKEFKSQTITKHMSNVQVYPTNHIRYGVRVEITISCHMDFDKYPMDSQQCPFQVNSYFSTERTATCTSEFTYNEKKQRNLQHSISIQSLPLEYRVLGDNEDRFSACGFYVSLKRKRTQIFFQVYLTSILFVIVSWASFLINPDIVPGRMGLLVTIFLVLINIFNGAKSSAPVSASLNAEDVYLVFCIGQVFLALVEYSMILYIEKIKNPYTSIKPKSTTMTTSMEHTTKVQTFFQPYSFRIKLDAVSFVTFPVLFIVFNITYWAIYF